MSRESNLLVVQPDLFFRDLIIDAMGNQSVEVQPETEVYLIHLLNRFMTTDNLYTRDENDKMREEPLALMVKEAIEEKELRQQKLLFQQLGDVSLYKSGFFYQSIQRKRVDIDYYIDMGGAAYMQVAARAEDANLQEMYQELASRFSSLVEVFAEVSDKTQIQSEQDIIRLYEVWLKTKNSRAEKTLTEAGIVFPGSDKKKVMH